jgi:hypothetical protein
LVEVVVCGVVLCQHPAPKITLRGRDRSESLRAGENVFDLHFCPPGIEGGAKQIYMDRSEKTARVTMVGDILGCPNLVVDGVFILDSYIGFVFLYV